MILKLLGAKPDLPFQQWRRDVHSQCGEDGIIERLLELLGISTGYFVEFGAWDGRHLSNSARLADVGWSGCFIEGDVERFKDLERNYGSNSRIAKVNAFVHADGKFSLDSILDSVDAPSDIGLLSIDIDGNDYYVWQGLKRRTPKLVVIEFNPSIPANVVYVQDNDPAVNRGASLAAFAELATEKGYSLVASTDWNAFFLQSDLARRFNVPTYTPAEVKNPEYEAAIFHGYDGTILVGGTRKLLWHGIEFGAEELQILPPKLRKLPIAQSDEFFADFHAFQQKRGG